MKRNFLVFLVIASIVFFSGCIEFGDDDTVETGHGVRITSFQAMPSEVFSGDSFDLLMDVQNVGDKTARDVEASITQTGGASESDDNGFGSGTNLAPPTDDFDGEIHTFEAEMDAPEITVGPESVTLKGRLYYEYETDARVLLPVMSREEYRTRIQAGDDIPGMGVSRVSRGPFTVDIDGPSPALIDDDDDEEDEMDFRFYIRGENIGNGVPYDAESHPNPTRDDIHEIEVIVNLPEDDADWVDDENCSDNVTVRAGNDFQAICHAKLQNHEDFIEIPIDVTLKYGYYIDSETSVNVLESI